MITTIEALNYQCLRYVNRDLEPFHILIGPNASGKSAFLDVVDFLRDLLYEGPEGAMENRANTIEELLWNHTGHCFELAVELSIPERLRNTTSVISVATSSVVASTTLKAATNRPNKVASNAARAVRFGLPKIWSNTFRNW